MAGPRAQKGEAGREQKAQGGRDQAPQKPEKDGADAVVL
jgi:hypothetical protein